jgi:hypothetical protein
VDLTRIRERADYFARLAQSLAPPGGTIPAGGSHWEASIKHQTLCELLAAAHAGKTPAECSGQARQFVRQAVALWNRRREWQVHRWDGMCDDLIFWATGS